MIRIFDKGIADVRRDFRGEGKEDRFFETFTQMANDPKLVGRVIERLFDFPKAKGRGENKLSEMSKRCIEISLIAFPELQILDKKEIAEGFLEKVSVNQRWNLESRKMQALAESISIPNFEVEATQSIRK